MPAQHVVIIHFKVDQSGSKCWAELTDLGISMAKKTTAVFSCSREVGSGSYSDCKLSKTPGCMFANWQSFLPHISVGSYSSSRIFPWEGYCTALPQAPSSPMLRRRVTPLCFSQKCNYFTLEGTDRWFIIYTLNLINQSVFIIKFESRQKRSNYATGIHQLMDYIWGLVFIIYFVEY